MFKQQRRPSLQRPTRRRLPPLFFLGAGVPLLLVLLVGVVFLLPHLSSQAKAINMDCTLIVPENPLSAQGLATPYQLVATKPGKGPCKEANPLQAAFVQGAVIDPATGAVSIYDPLVIDKGTRPAAAPVVPQLPANAIVGLWFGFNGANLTLKGTNGSLAQGMCVNGVQGSIFGQFAYCNAPTFFNTANQAIQAGQLKVPPLGMGSDGKPCPSVRDFTVVDMDQSDNVTTAYLANGKGKTAQMNAANAAALQNAQMLVNASDNRLVAVALDGALSCTPWMAPNLADPGQMVPALPLNELQAAANQAAPAALVPMADPMVLNNNNPDINKVNAYRAGVDQVPAANATANTKMYCTNMLNNAPARLRLDMPATQQRPSPDPAAANSLFTFLAQRFVAAFGANGLNCTGLLNVANPIKVKTDGNGVAIAATFKANNGNNGGNNGGKGGKGKKK